MNSRDLQTTAIKTGKQTKLYSEAVTLAGYGKYNMFVLLATGGCLMCVIIESMNMSFIIPAAHCDLKLSLAEKGILVSVNYLGIIVTSHFWGFMADVRGRKNILVFCLIASSIFTLLSSIAPWAWLFIILRFINGALIGGASSIIYPFAGEFHDNWHRPKVTAWISSFVAVAQIYIPGMAWAILPSDWSFYIEGLGISYKPWRLLLIAYGLPSLIVAAMLSLLPESPKFLLTQGKHDATLKILTTMFVINTGKKYYEYPVSTVIMDEIEIQKSETKPTMLQLFCSQSATLFNKEYALKTILICYLQFGVFLSASALALWFPQILNTLSNYAQTVTNAEVTLCRGIRSEPQYVAPVKSYYSTFNLWHGNRNTSIEDATCSDSVESGVFLVMLLTAVAIGITYVLIGIFINKVGKKLLLIGFVIFTGICGLIAQYISGYETILIFCGIYLLISALIGVVNALAVDLYPTSIRAMAMAVSLMVGRAGAMIGSNIVGVIFYNYCEYVFIFVAINHVILVVAAILLPTKKVQDIERTPNGMDAD